MIKKRETLKSEKGITIIALIIIIVIMVIIAGATVQSGIDELDEIKLNTFYTQLEVIQKRVDDIAATNESYTDENGNTINIKEQGIAYDALTPEQKTNLAGILSTENIMIQPQMFRYFTIEDLRKYFDIMEVNYNVFIDFNSRVIVAEEGVRANNKYNYVLENSAYFVEENTNKNIGIIQNLTYQVLGYESGKCKVIVTPTNTIGDLKESGYVKYKKTTTKYWETSANTEIILEKSIEYNIIYIDSNNNSLERKIKVELNNNNLTVIEL